MPTNLDTAALRTFVAVAETASMTAAANALHLTQGAVSQQVKRLEGTLGCALFDRGRRGLALTDPGRRLLARARRLLALNDEICAEMAIPSSEGTVRLGAPPDLVGPRIAPALKAFSAAHPRVEVSLTCLPSRRLAEALSAGAIDLGLVEEPAGRSRGRCLGLERLVWVGARGGAAHLRRPLPVSLVDEACAFRPALIEALGARGLEWRAAFENGSLDACLAMVRMDLAVTACLASAVPPDLDALAPEAGLPELPGFAVTLHLPRAGVPATVHELARHLARGFAASGPVA